MTPNPTPAETSPPQPFDEVRERLVRWAATISELALETNGFVPERAAADLRSAVAHIDDLERRLGERERDGKLDKLLAASKEWHGFNSNDNGHKLYNAASNYFGSDFNPYDYDNVP